VRKTSKVNLRNSTFTLNHSDGREAMQEKANDAIEMKRLSPPNITSVHSEPYPSFQESNCGRAYKNGYPHRTLRRTTILHAVLITGKRGPGLLKAASFRSGSRQLRFSGSMGNVCPVLIQIWLRLISSCVVAGSGKSVIWYVEFQRLTSELTDDSSQFHHHSRH